MIDWAWTAETLMWVIVYAAFIGVGYLTGKMMFGTKYETPKLDLRQLHQGTTWTGADGVTHLIEDMDEHHIMRVLGFLRRRAVDLDLADAMRTLWTVPPDKCFDWDEVCERDPYKWVEELEVVEAMKRRLTRYEVERRDQERKRRLMGTIHNDYLPVP